MNLSIILTIFLIIFAGLSFYCNISWLEHCKKINNDWYKHCRFITEYYEDQLDRLVDKYDKKIKELEERLSNER